MMKIALSACLLVSVVLKQPFLKKARLKKHIMFWNI